MAFLKPAESTPSKHFYCSNPGPESIIMILVCSQILELYLTLIIDLKGCSMQVSSCLDCKLFYRPLMLYPSNLHYIVALVNHHCLCRDYEDTLQHLAFVVLDN